MGLGGGAGAGLGMGGGLGGGGGGTLGASPAFLMGRTVAVGGLSGGAALMVKPAAGPALAPILSRAVEKSTLSGLNDRFSTYMAKVRELQQENAVLEAKLSQLTGGTEMSPETTSASSQEYETQLTESRGMLQTLTLDTIKLEIELDNIRATANELKAKYDFEQGVKFQLETDIASMKKDIEMAADLRVDLNAKQSNLLDELDYVTKSQKEELSSLHSKLGTTSTDMSVSMIEVDTDKSFDISTALNKIRMDYEKTVQQHREEADAYYKLKMDEMQKASVKSTAAMTSTRAEITIIKKELQALHLELQATVSMNMTLEQNLAEAQAQTGISVAEYQGQISSLESAIEMGKTELHKQILSYQELLDVKLALDLEISTYKKLLEGNDFSISVQPPGPVLMPFYMSNSPLPSALSKTLSADRAHSPDLSLTSEETAKTPESSSVTEASFSATVTETSIEIKETTTEEVIHSEEVLLVSVSIQGSDKRQGWCLDRGLELGEELAPVRTEVMAVANVEDSICIEPTAVTVRLVKIRQYPRESRNNITERVLQRSIVFLSRFSHSETDKMSSGFDELTPPTDFGSGDYDYNSTEPDIGLCDKSSVRAFRKQYEPPLYWVIFFLGAVGNLMVIWIYIYVRNRFKTMTDLYLFNLALADLLFLGTLPFWASEASSGWVFGLGMCKTVSALYKINFFSSMLLLTCISVDRYIAIVQATKAQNFKQKRLFCSKVVCVAVWLLSGMLALPEFLFAQVKTDDKERTFCSMVYWGNQNNRTKILVLSLQISMGFCLPFLVMFFCYSVIIHTLLQARNFEKHKALRVIFVVVAVFVLSQLPYNSLLVVEATQAANTTITDCDLARRFDIASQVMKSLAYTHSCLNPFLYVFIGVRFRNDLLKMLRACTCAIGQGKISKLSLSVPKRPSVMSDTETTPALSI
ncbi:hypothetical protein AAFF_G00002550 [Aldrovandia affinis]|uniref:Uncharacterized protein n=1 Tax=Aldrovandia affinis TaxID=143900 RepID=A0AAD7TD65_9TELE|nr:hypothetical protein AAFF_G00002550 [Aldrovandia affinis]